MGYWVVVPLIRHLTTIMGCKTRFYFSSLFPPNLIRHLSVVNLPLSTLLFKKIKSTSFAMPSSPLEGQTCFYRNEKGDPITIIIILETKK